MTRALSLIVVPFALLVAAPAHASDSPAYRDGRPLAHIAAADVSAAQAPEATAPVGTPPVLPANDPGAGQGWQALQWNFAGPFGVNAPRAWWNVAQAGARGGRSVTIAVLDTGVAYRNAGRFRRSPDLNPAHFVQGYDFVDNDRFPDDHNGHGTHVTSTINESTDNGIALTGLAYGARIMPIRVLDGLGEGEDIQIGRGIRYAASHGADIINLSLEFDPEITAGEIPELLSAVTYARERGVLVVSAAGNEGFSTLAWPARATRVLAVGATTVHGCLFQYSNEGRGLDIVAPGGGRDAIGMNDPNCRPDKSGRPIYQLTYTGGSVRRFGLPGGYEGTSMAAAHVSAVAALVIASKVLGPNPTPTQLEQHLKATARDLGAPGVDERYGAGLLDAGAATEPLGK